MENLFWIAASDEVVPEPDRNTRWSSHYIQTANIDASETREWFDGAGWKPIGRINPHFIGSYDGQNHTIDSLFINRPNDDYIGLFSLTFVSTIENLGVTNVNINGNELVGSLMGFKRNSTISNCYSTGSVTGRKSHVGGLAGMQVSNSVINNSYNKANVNGGDWDAGGLVGFRGASTISNSYYNTEISGQRDEGKGEPRTTEQMTYHYCEDTYVDWDFDEIWSPDFDYLVNDGYPFLKWQFSYNPNVALNPSPADNTKEVSVDLKELQWDYIADEADVNPAGFRVYLSDTEELSEEDDFLWVPYVEEQVEYKSSEILPAQLEYFTSYYWKVVPTTKEQGTGEGVDAEDVPVWSFRTEKDTSIEQPEPRLVTKLKNNYPNPFNPNTIIRYSLEEKTNVELLIYNTRGQVVRSLVDDS